MRIKNFHKKFIKAFIILSIPLITGNKALSSTNELNQINNRNLSNNNTNKLLSEIKWEKIPKKNSPKLIIWDKYDKKDNTLKKEKISINEKYQKKKFSSITSLNRSIIFDNKIVGPDIGWLVPPGFLWNEKFKFDFSTRGHNRRGEGEPFLGWNDGDAVGQFYYQPIFYKNYSFGLNLGMRSVYSSSSSVSGAGTSIGDGLSLGFRLDKKLSNTSGLAFGAEQLLHFNGITDTGRDIYLTASKGWFRDDTNNFPLTVGTFGFATGKMAEGNIKGLCSDLFGGSGTEANHKRPLCWSPVFSLARIYNTKFSTFFEYNSKWFLLGSSISPFQEIPLRGTFAVQLSDHIENYKINSFEELKWVFRLSLGF